MKVTSQHGFKGEIADHVTVTKIEVRAGQSITVAPQSGMAIILLIDDGSDVNTEGNGVERS